MTGIAARLPVVVDDGATNDAFGRLRVSSPFALFAVQNQYDAEPLQMEGGASGTGVAPAHDANTRMVALSCTAGTGVSFFQSYEYIPYQPGKSQLGMFTFVIGAAVANVTVDTGIFDVDNGIFLRQNGTSGIQVVRRTKTSGSVVDNAVSQSSFNLDKLDGTGPSGVTFDVTMDQLLIIDAQFLSMGRARIGFSFNGRVYYVHQFLHTNVISVPYMQTLALPVAMVMTATASGSTKTSYFKCAAVSSEGGVEDIGYRWSTAEQAVTAASGARTHIASMRPMTTFNSKTNRSRILIHSVGLVAGANPVYWELAIGSTFSAGPTWPGTAVNAYSAAEATTAVGTLSAVGAVIESGYLASSNVTKGADEIHLSKALPITLDRAGAVRANGTLSLFVTGISGTSDCRAVFNYSEVR